MKSEILAILNSFNGVISGTEISRRLKVSRVAVWKHIQKLQQAGYNIESTPKGYRMLEAPDSPYPWAFGSRADRVHYFPEISSTMHAAMELAQRGCPSFSLIVADTQTQGRGRLQRRWESQLGGLYFTFVIRPQISPAHAPLINLAAAVDLADVIAGLYQIEVNLKWPNDILVDGNKLAGILSVMETDQDLVHFVNLGIGINVNNMPDFPSVPAVSIRQLVGHDVSRSQLLNAFWDAFERRLAEDRLTGVIEHWKRSSTTLGKQVQIHMGNMTYEGRAVDIEGNGALVLETNSGDRVSVVYGDCFYS